MKKHLTKLFVTLSLMAVVISCKKEDPTPPVPTLAEKTIIFYMVADNNLASLIHENVQEVIRTQNIDLVNNNVVIFIDYEIDPEKPNTEWIGSTDPQIIRVLPGNRSVIVKSYPETNSSEKTFAKKVIGEILSEFPAKKYGFVFGSHGSGWEYEAETRAFGGDENPVNDPRKLNMPALAEMLPTNCDFLVFDACVMSTVEVVREFRDKVENLIVSDYLVPGFGLKYDVVLPMLMKGDYKGAIDDFIAYYLKSGELASLAWVKPAKINDLITEHKRLLTILGANYDDVVKMITPTQENPAPVQELSDNNIVSQYDYADFMSALANYKGKKDEVKPLLSILSQIVAYEKHTNYYEYWLYDEEGKHETEEREARTNCGLSVYVPFFAQYLKSYEETYKSQFTYYKGLAWYKESGSSAIFPENLPF